MAYVLAGEGDFCLDFLIPVLQPESQFTVIYKTELHEDYLCASRIDHFLQIFSRQQSVTVTASEEWLGYFNLVGVDWPIHNADMLKLLFDAYGANAAVKVRDPASGFDDAF
ncbi:MAG: hypothetical protein AAGL17_18890, partial [Cyanobacteria bacterium J06576_12]